MASIKELAERQQEQEAAAETRKQSFNNYYPQEGDRVFFAFVWTGEDGDEWFEYYGAHEVPPGPNQNFASRVFCPVLTRWSSEPCRYCGQDLNTKEMMRIGMYVFSILRKNPPKAGQVPPLVNYQGQQYYAETVNDYRVWDTSAWNESPFKDIIWHANAGQIQAQQFELAATGSKLARRYKIHPLQGSPMPQPDEIVRIKADNPTVRAALMASTIKVQTVTAPNAAVAAPGPAVHVPANPSGTQPPVAQTAATVAESPTVVEFNPGASPTTLAPTQMVEPAEPVEFDPTGGAAPVEAPAQSPAQVPATAPAQAPVTAPAQAPVTDPTQAPVTASAQVPVTAPVEVATEIVDPDAIARMEAAAAEAPAADSDDLPEPDPNKLFGG